MRRAVKDILNECTQCPKPRIPCQTLCEKHRRQNNALTVHRQRELIQTRLSRNLRVRLSKAVHRGSAVRDLGCSVDELKQHLESKFQPGMTWNNYGTWHIDHVKPLALFDLTDREQLLKACHYTNLQPLWAEENLRKSAKVL